MEWLLRSTESTVPRMSYRLLLFVPRMSPSPPDDEQAATTSRANAAATMTFVVLMIGFPPVNKEQEACPETALRVAGCGLRLASTAATRNTQIEVAMRVDRIVDAVCQEMERVAAS